MLDCVLCLCGGGCPVLVWWYGSDSGWWFRVNGVSIMCVYSSCFVFCFLFFVFKTQNVKMDDVSQ